MTYQGDKNHSTSIVNRWLTQEEKIRSQIGVLASDANNQAKTLAKEIRELITDLNNPLSGHNSLYTDLLETAFAEVDWQEIAEAFLKSKSSHP